MDTKFTDWLNDQLKDRNMSMRELARRGDISHTSVSKVLQGETRPTADFCIGVAKGLNHNPDYVLALAGHIAPRPEHTERLNLKKLYYILTQMSDNQLREVRHYAQYLANISEQDRTKQTEPTTSVETAENSMPETIES